MFPGTTPWSKGDKLLLKPDKLLLKPYKTANSNHAHLIKPSEAYTCA